MVEIWGIQGFEKNILNPFFHIFAITLGPFCTFTKNFDQLSDHPPPKCGNSQPQISISSVCSHGYPMYRTSPLTPSWGAGIRALAKMRHRGRVKCGCACTQFWLKLQNNIEFLTSSYMQVPENYLLWYRTYSRSFWVMSVGKSYGNCCLFCISSAFKIFSRLSVPGISCASL